MKCYLSFIDTSSVKSIQADCILYSFHKMTIMTTNVMYVQIFYNCNTKLYEIRRFRTFIKCSAL